MLEEILNILFPSKCTFCGKIERNYICKKCEIKLKYLKKDKIEKIKDEYLSFHLYAYNYKNEIREKMLELKFGDKPQVSYTFSKLLLKNKKICDFLKSYDIIIPVPMHRKKQNQRGYNQAELISKKIATSLGVEYDRNILAKVKQTVTQSSLNAMQRKNNVKNAYQCINAQKITNKKVVLFDDIYTTGSTAKECAKAIKSANAKEVIVLTFAKD